ncbi:tyrosine-type recombinase/integrase [Haloarchaeobius sp. HRN-SO-5]|uniref:tyrosine-type recombinase/integrase n=1 Tax=Haloarchaeobius sp. HRN-SO-5 TaxID=3446118 RepID=UPI003EB874AE
MTPPDTDDEIARIANAFGRDPDPLAKHQDRFEQLDVDPLDAYFDRVLLTKDPSESTRKNYQYAFDQWREFMQQSGRHFACPSNTYVSRFIEHLLQDRGNSISTVKRKIGNINRAYEWWQEHHAFPHPADYNPFRIALREADLGTKAEELKHPPISIAELRSVVADCTNVRERLFLVWQLKFGLRVGELLNIRLEDIAIAHSGLKEWYPEIGTSDALSGYENALYIPSKYEREGNKSSRPRILPLDDETKHVLMQYLPTRPTVEEPWLILSKRTFEKMEQGDTVNTVWKDHFSEYNDLDGYRKITSHYGRHYFTSYWKLKENIPRELVQYMRGDKLGAGEGESIDEYLTAHYQDIRGLYRERIFNLL